MELKPGMAALVTGGAAGIGKALSLALAQKGTYVTIVDFSEERGKEVTFLIEKEHRNYHGEVKCPLATFVKCDVTNARDLSSAFQKHMETYGRLDICINSAGISTWKLFHEDKTDGSSTWRRTINVNLIAVIDCTRLAIEAMRLTGKGGIVLNLGSAGGLYPLYDDPIYSTSKAGVVMFTRALAPLKREGIRVNVLCPEFIQTEMAAKANPRIIDALGGFIPMDMLVDGAFELIKDDSKAGSCLWITNRKGMEYWPTAMEERRYLVSSKSKRSIRYPEFSIKIPNVFGKIIVHKLDHNFRNATKIVQENLRLPVKPRNALVKIVYAGVNASDVNFSSGSYFSGGAKEAAARLPFDAGFEAVGLIAAVGDSVHLKVGTPVALMSFGSYAEFVMVPAKHLLPIPRLEPEVVAMLTSGLTASIALDKAGQMQSGQVVLVTAAAGGTGQFAVQLAKLAGNKVVATCGGEGKASLLRSLGVDRVIDYKEENIKDALKREFPKGVDIIYESVGGEMFDICLNALAIYGRMIVIGMISQYQGEHGWKPLAYTGLCEKILAKSQTVVAVDPKKFIGLQSVADAVEYLHSGRSLGKVVVRIDPEFGHQSSKL